MIFKNIIDKRAQEGRREDDTLQYLIDQGDDVTKIITVSSSYYGHMLCSPH
jgi:sterol 14-demethylase